MLLLVDVSLAQTELPAEFRGDWVSAETDCASSVRFRVASDHVTLINGPDSTSYGDVAVAHSFFGPDYTGISVAAIPESNSDNYPFLIYFNSDEQVGVTKLEIYQEIPGTLNPQVSAIQAAAKKLAERYPLNSIPLKKCIAD